MSNVNYQPTGVYPQFVSNPSLLNSKGETAVHENNNSNKAYKIIGCAAIGAAAAGAFAAQYKKETNAIKLKKEVFGNSTFKNFINKEKYSESEMNYLIRVWDEGIKYSDGLTGKIHDGLIKICKLFKDNFYNY